MTSFFGRATRLFLPAEPSLGGDVVERTLRELSPEMRLWIARWTGRNADVDDILQDALIELADALERYRGDASLRTYARRITLRVAMRAKRRRREEATPDLHVVRDPAALSPETLANDRAALVRFHDALASLSEKRRSAFVLCDIEELSHEEAAEVEAVSLETLRARLKHARADLRALLQRDELVGRFFGDEETR